MSSKKRSERRRTPYQNLGVQLALKVGIPQTCPLWNGNDECSETREPCSDCNLDSATNIDYRLCDTFSQWFWREVQKMESGLTVIPANSSPEGTLKKKEKQETDE